MKSIGYVNGNFIEDLMSEAIPLEDRGHQFGDGVYEVVKVYQGKVFSLKEHLARFKRSANEIKISLDYTDKEIEQIIDQLLEKSGAKAEKEEAMVYWQVTRGVYPRKHYFADVKPNLSVTIRPNKGNVTAMKEGVKVTFKPDLRWARCDIKSLNLLPNILAKQEALEEGFFESILVRDGKVLEGGSCNVFCIKDGKLYTAPKTNSILWGITRGFVLELANELNIPVIEEAFTPDFLQMADEAFITSSSMEIMPVVKVNDYTLGNATPGPITQNLQKAYWANIETDTGVKLER